MNTDEIERKLSHRIDGVFSVVSYPTNRTYLSAIPIPPTNPDDIGCAYTSRMDAGNISIHLDVDLLHFSNVI